MTQKIQMGVEGVFDSSDIEKGVKKVIDSVGNANKTQIEPVSEKTEAQLDAVNKAIEQVGESVNKVNQQPLAPVDGKAEGLLDAIGKGIDKLGDKVNKTNRQPLNPVSDKPVKTLDTINRKFQEYLKVDTELRRRARATGQLDTPFEAFDFSRTHPNARARADKIKAVQRYIGAEDDRPAHAPVPPPPPTKPPTIPGQPNQPSGGGMAVNVLQAGLSAAGPVGRVASSAVGTGVAAGAGGGAMAGAGAGLMGLMGGLLALGVGKIVGSVMEKMDQAEGNAIGYDRLKRAIGDVSVSFDGLKAAMTSGADAVKVTFGEMTALSSQFAKDGNLQAGQYSSLPEEVGTGVGLSRSFGLDPAQGVGVMGQLRGMKVTTDAQESRRFALLIGETIGKSGAFAKADEVMEAIGNYAVSQTRASMGGANVEGYGGMYSSMVGSGIPGMDPSGAGGILARINAALSAGGAKGEASQFMTARVGSRMGLNPLQTQVMREGGAFATNDGMFGDKSAYARYMGHAGPKGGTTFLQGTMDEVKQQYRGDSDDDKLMRAQAFANHAGVNMNQSMAMLSLKPNQMGDMQKYVKDLSKVDATGIGNIAKVVTGTDADRQTVSKDLLAREDVSVPEKEKIRDAMASKDDETQKRVLAEIIAAHGQERTQGSDIRDSKNLLDNLKTAVADKLIPISQDMRAGILHLAGKGEKTGDQVLRDIAEMESKDKTGKVNRKAAGERAKINDTFNQLVDDVAPSDLPRQQWHKDAAKKLKDGTFTSKDRVEYEERVKKFKADSLKSATDPEVIAKRRELEEERRALLNDVDKNEKKELREENDRLRKRLNEIDTGADGMTGGPDLTGSVSSGGARGGTRFDGGGGEGGSQGSSGANITAMNPAKRDEAMRFFMDKGWTKEQAAGIVSNLAAESAGLNADIKGDGGKAYGVAQWHPDRQAAFEKKYGKSIHGSTRQEQYEFVNYELTEGNEKAAGDRLKQAKTAAQSGDVVTRYYERPKYVNRDATVRAAAAEKIAAMPIGAAPVVAASAPAAGPVAGDATSAAPAAKVAPSPGITPVPPVGKVESSELPPIGAAPVAGAPPAAADKSVAADGTIKVEVVRMPPAVAAFRDNERAAAEPRQPVADKWESEVRSALDKASRGIDRSGTPLPPGLARKPDDDRDYRATITAEPIIVRHENSRGEMVRPDQSIQTGVRSNWGPR